MPQFDVSTFYSQIFWLLTVFSLLYLVVSRFVSPVTEQIFKSRKIVVDDAVKEAELLTLKTATLKKEYDVQYKNILHIAEEIKKESIENLNNSFAEKNMSLLEELEKKRKESLSKIELELKDFLYDHPQTCIELADFIIQKITNKKPEVNLLNQCYERVK